MKSKLFYHFILIIVFICKILGQEYLPIEGGKCEKYIGDSGEKICDGYLANPESIYVYNKTQEETQTELKNLISILKLTNPDKVCINPNNYKIMCSMMFPECIDLKSPNVSKSVSLPIYTCNNFCKEALTTCSVSSSIASCNKGSTLPIQLPYTPIEWVKYNLSNYGGIDNYTVECTDPTLVKSGSDSEIQVECIEPLIKRITNDSKADLDKGYFYVNSQCVINCPVTGMHSKLVWNQIFKINDVLSSISLVCTLILLFTFGILNPKLNRFDKKNLFFIAGVFGMSLSGVLIAANGSEKTVCPTPERYAVNTDRVCVASGFLVHFSALFAILWWTIGLADVYYGIKYVGKKIKIKIRYYLIVTMIISLAFTLVPLGTGQYQAGLSNVMCFLKDEIYQSMTFFVPLGICLTLGTILMILVMKEIYVIVKSKSSSNSKSDSISYLKLQVKPMLNIILFYFTFLYLFLFVRVVNSRYQEYEDSAIPYMLCLAKGGGNSCLLKGPSAGSLGYFAYCLRIYGIYLFIISFLSSRTIKIWKESIILNNSFVTPIVKFFDSSFSGRFSSSKNTTTTQNSTFNNTNGSGSGVGNSSGMTSIGLESRNHNIDDDDL
ncbi:hypothetical protein RB653_001819 [Dictyostelium firmibasis]|uniref:G-protein coupled receptors family 2 profile 2 domain-containing protein n=1 Tax=Dictyostelium firmibasis TaxID=79012 RepID=A0AAN7TVE0_9MYCE